MTEEEKHIKMGNAMYASVLYLCKIRKARKKNKTFKSE
jgi:hypothetical protein